MNMKRRSFFYTVMLASVALMLGFGVPAKGLAVPSAEKPNMIFIMLDDMGYGDATCYNPESKIPTPNIDGLAKSGMRFTDAHAAGSVCVPSRFGFLTGTYPIEKRGYHKKGKLGGLIEEGRLTIPLVLKSNGYQTAMFGKWHNGFWNWNTKGAAVPEPLEGGPVGCGFDTYFGVPHSLDMQPYLYVRNDMPVGQPTEDIAASDSINEGWTRIQGKFWRKGKKTVGFKHEEVVEKMTGETIAYLEKRKSGAAGKPFFLYVAFPGPHTPWVPSTAFVGKSGIGPYGDYLMEIDDCIGRILSALEKTGEADHTLVCLSSDNGPVWYPTDVEKSGHSASAELRGMKGDVFEAGHRVPFIAFWPGRIKPESTCDEVICLTDLMRTFASAADVELPESAGPDSVDILPLMLGGSGAVRETTLHTGWKESGLRKGKYKYIDTPTSGGFTQVDVAPDAPAGQLYDLKSDLGETTNLYNSMPEKVKELKDDYEAIIK